MPFEAKGSIMHSLITETNKSKKANDRSFQIFKMASAIKELWKLPRVALHNIKNIPGASKDVSYRSEETAFYSPAKFVFKNIDFLVFSPWGDSLFFLCFNAIFSLGFFLFLFLSCECVENTCWAWSSITTPQDFGERYEGYVCQERDANGIRRGSDTALQVSAQARHATPVWDHSRSLHLWNCYFPLPLNA